LVIGVGVGAFLGFVAFVVVVLFLCRKQMKAYAKESRWLSAKSRNTSLGPARTYTNGPPSVSSNGASTAPLLNLSPKKLKSKEYAPLQDEESSRCSIQMEVKQNDAS
jgi:hypothetical protein